MNCAEFENALARLMGDETPGAERSAGLSALRQHARRCRECAGSDELLEWLELPAVERDLADTPGEAYWSSFDERLRRRLDGERRCGTRAAWRIGVAAALALLLAGSWLYRQLTPETPRESPAERLVQVAPEPGPPALPDELSEMLDNAPVEELATVIPWDTPSRGELFPDAADLDDEARRELLQWLNDQSARARGVS